MGMTFLWTSLGLSMGHIYNICLKPKASVCLLAAVLNNDLLPTTGRNDKFK